MGITIGLGLIAGELATRFAFRDVTTTGGPSYFTSRWRDANPKNSLGFREREIGPERAADGLRIAVVGDSFTEGPGLAETERLSSQLEQALERSSDGVEVLNFGRAGAETVDELEVLREVVSPLRPDFVLLQWFVNDVEGHHKEGRPEPWPLLPLPSTHATLKHHSALYFVMNLTWENIQVHLGLTGSYDDYLVRRFADPDGQASKEAFESLEQFFATAERAGIPMGMVLFPLLDESSIDKLGFLLDRVLESCAEHHVICIDLRPALAEVGNLRRLHLNRFDEHPNGVAHAIAARAVLEAFEPLWINGLAARPDPGRNGP